jgi:hypothetical protein
LDVGVLRTPTFFFCIKKTCVLEFSGYFFQVFCYNLNIMLKKENRLTKKEFDFVFKNGQKKFSKNFMFLKIEKKDLLKISTTVSKKIYKTAVERNEARRVIYKILQENFEKIPQDF